MRAAMIATALVAASSVVSGPAQAATPASGPDGPKCSITTVTDVGEPSMHYQTGEVKAGPLLITNAIGAPVHGTVRCRVVVGLSPQTHDSPSLYSLSETSSQPGVVILSGPANMEVLTEDLYLCTQFTYATGQVVYWDSPNGSWDTSSSTSGCLPMTRYDTTVQSPAATVYSQCGTLSQVPVIANTLRNVAGCNLPPPPAGTYVAYVALPEY